LPIPDHLTGYAKTPHLPFDKLRANGAGVENIGDFPFMLSPSKHEKSFFRTLLKEVQSNCRSAGFWPQSGEEPPLDLLSDRG